MAIATTKARNLWNRHALAPRSKTLPAWNASVAINHANDLHHGRFDMVKAFPNHPFQALHGQTVFSQARLPQRREANEKLKIR
jgi:hypothetical protein